MSAINNTIDLSYTVYITMKGDIPLEERAAEALIRVNRYLDMIHKVNLNNDTDICKIYEFSYKYGIYIPTPSWITVKHSYNLEQTLKSQPHLQQENSSDVNKVKTQTNTTYPLDQNILNNNTNYFVSITMNGHLPIKDRHAEALMKLNKAMDMIQEVNIYNDLAVNEVYQHLYHDNIYLPAQHWKIIKDIKELQNPKAEEYDNNAMTQEWDRNFN